MSKKILVNILFNPVGQGLFSCGFLSDYDMPGIHRFTWVYDCGTVSKCNGIASGIDVLDQALSGADDPPKIDLLILSHFDTDHISGVVRLLQRYRVETLLIPLVPLWHRLLLLYGQGGYVRKAIRPFFLDPVSAFSNLEGANIGRIIFVPPSSGEGSPQDLGDGVSLSPNEPKESGDTDRNRDGFDLSSSQPLQSLPSQEMSKIKAANTPKTYALPVGARLTVDDLWEFVPYNDADVTASVPVDFIADADARRQSLLNAGSENERTAALSSLKRFYESKYPKGRPRNELSLFLYSGGTGKAGRARCICHRFPHLKFWMVDWEPYCFGGSPSVSVLYTGDGFLDSKDKLVRLANYLGPTRVDELLILQAMHHGARNNWYSGLARQINARCTVFCSDPGHKKYGHPHDEVRKDFESIGDVRQVDKTTGFVVSAIWKSI